MSMFMRPTSVEMRKPMPTIGVPKNSATMAPISARVELIFSALKMKGSGGRQPQLEQRLPVAGGIGAHQVALHRPEAASPATVFTSIGKKVMTTTTAAFDCQSKPNHMTMIGATPTIGSAETRLPIGSSPRCRNGDAVGEDRDEEAGAAADDVAGEHRLEEGLPEIGARGSAASWRCARRWRSAAAAG